MFFESWDNLYRVLVVGVLAYAGLILLLLLVIMALMGAKPV